MNKSFAIIAAAGILAFAGASQAAGTGSGETNMTATTQSSTVQQPAGSEATNTRAMGAPKAKKTKVAKKRVAPMAQTGSGETSMTPTTRN